ncbi:DUF4350 domain-containing protein, partial [Chloroflexota bacterium]
NGIKDINTIIPALPLISLSSLPSYSQEATLILIPYLDFTQVELEELNSFVTRGGTLVLADDYGFGNQILEYMGLKVQFSGYVLLDPLFSYKNKWLPRISNITASPITSNIKSLIFNHATCLRGVESDDTLARSSSFSFLDLNDNQLWDNDEPTGPLPVISRHNLGSGHIVLISDPSLFINSMETIESNYNFIQNIAAITTSQLLIDQSHLPPSNLHQTKNILTYAHSLLITPVGTLCLVILTLTITLIPIWYKKGDKARLLNTRERRRY